MGETDFVKLIRDLLDDQGLKDMGVTPGETSNWYRFSAWGYYFYKQVARAGRPGMAVARTMAMDSEIAIIGFAGNGTPNPDAFVVVNIGKARKVNLRVKGPPPRLSQPSAPPKTKRICMAALANSNSRKAWFLMTHRRVR